MLNLLLAGLFDNTSGKVIGGPYGVNGTFQSITYQAALLGLDPAVLNAIPNEVLASDGWYPAPKSYEPHVPTPSIWGAFWNAVTSVVETPAGGLLSLARIAWDAAAATFTYFDQLATEAASIGGAIIARTAHALEAVGQLLLTALQVLLAWIVTAIDDLVGPVLRAVHSAIHSYAEALWSDFTVLWGLYDDSSSGAGATALQMLSDVFGTPFLLALGIGFVIAIALPLLSVVTLGAGFLGTLLISLFLTAALTVGSSYSSGLLPTSLLSPSVVTAASVVYNNSTEGSGSQGQIVGRGLFGLASTGPAGPFFGPLIWIFHVADAEIGLVKSVPAGIGLGQMVSSVGFGEYGLVNIYPLIMTAIAIVVLFLAVATLSVGGVRANGLLRSRSA